MLRNSGLRSRHKRARTTVVGTSLVAVRILAVYFSDTASQLALLRYGKNPAVYHGYRECRCTAYSEEQKHI